MVITPKNITYLIIVFFTILSCNRINNTNGKDIVVQIDDMVLTKSELKASTPQNLSHEDSIDYTQNFITRWVKSKLLLRKAELNLTPEEKDVTQILENYRASLLIHKYKQKLLLQKYSPLITQSEIEEYYNDMKDNFKLDNSIIKGIYIKLPLNAPKLNQLKKWYKSDNPEDSIALEEYCYQNAAKYENFLDKWVTVENISKLLPVPIPSNNNFLKYQNHYEVDDSTSHYFVSIRDYHLPLEIAPLQFVEDKIKAILLNKKRIEFIKDLEEELYQEGIKEKVIKFY